MPEVKKDLVCKNDVKDNAKAKKDSAKAKKDNAKDNKDNAKANTAEESAIKALFNDVSSFKGKNISLLLRGGAILSGKLISFDEVANCVIEQKMNQKTIVFGKSIVSIYDKCSIVL